MRKLTILAAAVLCLGMRTGLRAQGPPVAAQRSLSGTWTPVDPAQGDQLFSVGLSPISGAATVTIDQRPSRFTVTIALPEDKLDVLVKLISGSRFATTVSYNVPPQVRPGGYGAAGVPEVTEPMWVGDHFVIPDALAGWRPNWTTYSLKGDDLEVVMSHRVPATGQNQSVTQLLKKAH